MLCSEKVVLVAGGTGALGRVVSLAFLEQGAAVVVAARGRERFGALQAAAGNDRERLFMVAADVTDAMGAARMAEEVVGRHGRVDVLVNAVGGYEGGASVWETEPQSYERMIAANLTSQFALVRAVLPHMIRQGRGWVVGVASRAAFQPGAGAAAYAASKAGAVALFAAVAEEVKRHRVNVNLVAPAIFDTPANRQAMPGVDPSSWTAPEDIARVVLFLCSEAARAVHGAVVPVYGAA